MIYRDIRKLYIMPIHHLLLQPLKSIKYLSETMQNIKFARDAIYYLKYLHHEHVATDVWSGATYKLNSN